jgi:murein DD-endopeptidase MepM/ murein hydrolase activator NlpD
VGKGAYMKRRILCLIIVIVISVPCNKTYADTSKDLFKLYEIKSQTDLDKADSKLSKAENDYRELKKSYQFTNLYNTVVMLTNSGEVSSQLQQYQSECTKLENKMLSNIDAPLEEIMSDENAYISDLSKVNYLLLALDSYNNVQNASLPDGDLQKLQSEYESAKSNKSEKEIKDDLGVIKGVIQPIQAAYVVASPYGNRAITGDAAKTKFHHGIDLQADLGTGVLSVFNGIVIYSGLDETAGETIKINHGNGIVTVYSNLRDRYVKEGDSVKQYQKIGATGQTSKENIGTNLHLSLYINNKSYDPNILFRKEDTN